MPRQNINIAGHSGDVTVEVKMPLFSNNDHPIVIYRLLLVYGNISQEVGTGTNTDNTSDQHRLPLQADQLQGKLLCVDYTLVEGTNVNVSFTCSIGNSSITETLQQTYTISSFLFQ